MPLDPQDDEDEDDDGDSDSDGENRTAAGKRRTAEAMARRAALLSPFPCSASSLQPPRVSATPDFVFPRWKRTLTHRVRRHNQGAVGLSREEVYKAYSKGTLASKKKKQAKLKREIVKVCEENERERVGLSINMRLRLRAVPAPQTRVPEQGLRLTRDLPFPSAPLAPSQVRRRAKREEEGAGDGKGFSAIMLLHDPQGFAEKLFGRIHGGGGDAWETKLLALQVLSRLIGMHKLQVLNFYPLLQRYVQPQQRDATRILACAAQARARPQPSAPYSPGPPPVRTPSRPHSLLQLPPLLDDQRMNEQHL